MPTKPATDATKKATLLAVTTVGGLINSTAGIKLAIISAFNIVRLRGSVMV